MTYLIVLSVYGLVLTAAGLFFGARERRAREAGDHLPVPPRVGHEPPTPAVFDAARTDRGTAKA